MSDDFKVGDVVRLSCSEIRMTVEVVVPTSHIACVWFDGDRLIRRAGFSPAVLVKYYTVGDSTE